VCAEKKANNKQNNRQSEKKSASKTKTKTIKEKKLLNGKQSERVFLYLREE